VEKIQSNFEFWLPLDNHGEKIKKELFRSNLAYYSIFLFSFILIVIFSIITSWLTSKEYLIISTTTGFFYAGAVMTAIAITAAKSFTSKYFILIEKLQQVKGYKWFVSGFILFTVLIIYFYYKGFENNIYLILSLIANVITIIAFFINLFSRKN